MNAYDGTPKRRITVVWRFIQFLVPGLAVMTLADAHALRVAKPVATVYVLDVSDSIDATDPSITYISDSARHRQHASREHLESLVVFGRDAAVELPPTPHLTINSLKAPVDRHGTNLEQALTTAGNLIGNRVQGRIVLVSDGNQTEGNPATVISDLKARGIPVDVLPVTYSYTHEVWLERLDLPDLNSERQDVVVVVGALDSGRGKLVLSDRTRVVAEREIEYVRGSNQFRIPVEFPPIGQVDFTATVEVPQSRDSRLGNNSLHNSIHIGSRGKILIVASDPDANDVRQFSRALPGDRHVVIQPASGVPRDATQLDEYRLIIFCNVAAEEFDVQQLQSIETAVRELGAGFLMTGGPHSFGPGGYDGTVIDDVLPVSMVEPAASADSTNAVVILLEKLRIPEGMTWSKRIAKQAVKALRPNDQVGLLAYTQQGYQWVFPLTAADRYEQLVPLINGATLDHLPSFHYPMELALKDLQRSDAAGRHMIILTSGAPEPPNPKLLQQFIDAKVSVSTVVIFPPANSEIGISNLKRIAHLTKGRFYSPEDPNDVAPILRREAKMRLRSQHLTTEFTPTLGQSSASFPDLEDLPKLNGYAITTCKRDARQILDGPRRRERPQTCDPIFVIGNYGLGRTAAFTADWKTWDTWSGFKPFLQSLVNETFRSNHLRVMTTSAESGVMITVDDMHPRDSTLKVEASITGARPQSPPVLLTQIGPRRYQGTVPFQRRDWMRVKIRATGESRDETVSCATEYSARNSPEFLQFQSNRTVLEKLATETKGRVLTGDANQDAAFVMAPAFNQTSQADFDWFLISLALVMPLLLALRLAWIETKLAWNHEPSQPVVSPSPTFVTLMKTKLWVTEALSSKGKGRLLIQMWSPAPRSAWWQQPHNLHLVQPPAESSESADDKITQSTIEKLLTLKRQLPKT